MPHCPSCSLVSGEYQTSNINLFSNPHKKDVRPIQITGIIIQLCDLSQQKSQFHLSCNIAFC